MARTAGTGFPGLDKVLCNLMIGDNVVWQVDSVDDYRRFAVPFVEESLAQKRRVIYIRFATHEPIIPDRPDVERHTMNAAEGFETFTSRIHNIIKDAGIGAYYVFDCLSELQDPWATDLMIGNFFKATCPYLYELDTIAYFGILRDSHSHETVAKIRDTTQLLLDLHHFEGSYYIHPVKVWNRHSPTMFLPHKKEGDNFNAVTSSVDCSRLFEHISANTATLTQSSIDYFDKLFLDAQELLENPSAASEQIRETRQKLCEIMIGRESRILKLAVEYFSLEQLLTIKSRLIGSGYIGGKAAGMLLAQNILLRSDDFAWSEYIEPHDSYYIGSDVFYTYIVDNGCWKLRMDQKTPEGYFKLAAALREELLNGRFPNSVRDSFQQMMDSFGQSPIIVRSSSLLEDSFGNAFAGKYESVFLVNQGSPEERFAAFEAAVKYIYASTMSDNALSYRKRRGLDQEDEQMAILVQRVSGSYRGDFFFPDMAGVGISYNTFVWKPHLDPKAGMLRLVTGLGTRAVDRVEDDYPRIIALDDPLLRPQADIEDIRKFSQRKVDILDFQTNTHRTIKANSLLHRCPELNIDMMAEHDLEAEKMLRERNIKPQTSYVLTFKKLLSETQFCALMQRMLKTIEKVYNYPVDMEFTVNFNGPKSFRVNLVQCRPLQAKGIAANVKIPESLEKDKILLETTGSSMGGSISQKIDKIIYIHPAKFIGLDNSEKYTLAREIGRVNRRLDRSDSVNMLMGPGRWGTTTPSLGVPVSFSEINNTSVLVEMAYEGSNLMPELSFGTHFFQDLVETGIFYLALFPKAEGVTFNRQRLLSEPNIINEILGEQSRFGDIIHVIDCTKNRLNFMSDVVSQRAVCFFN
ncbi:Phosphoenolpyruvate synthase [Limihaloglobus sulfuriphilus]|uniref:Phosphoenolpyruvate synthase n=1 Tax=Limihaloglobus sulfuriphilus TaxID=1851148 RepID=A0A1Q2MHC8_9BACT|nr:PEP/pyruvate-binding domain-containing protein [Limihaloglobus sulfuriphilus]AQQ71662.1 Phosphoenolpyruvate synthase [Limihaloglobus sulfuriphilus]